MYGDPDRPIPLALRVIPAPHYADTVFVAIPKTQTMPDDPAFWARHVFSVRSAPRWVLALLALRQAVVGLIGVERSSSSVFDVDSVEDGEALVAAEERHLDFAASVRIDPEHRLLSVTTSVSLHGWRGRLYFVPVSILHGPVLRAMATRAVRRAAA